MPSVGDILEGKDICICAGSGGVGKTTTSAAIAMGMAARGKRVAVVTIDPAKRLANALGLEALDNRPRRVGDAVFAEHGLTLDGELWAMMLDPKATFDELIARHAPDAESRDRILQNRIYKQLSNALAGSQEYMAMERLFELHQEGRYDLLVLDTPPTRNALDFLEAPKRLTQFIEGRSLQMFMKPTGLGMKLLGAGSSVMFSRKRMPPAASATRQLAPMRSRWRPSWGAASLRLAVPPNSCCSMSSGVGPEQSTLTNGALRFEPCRWIARAIISRPVPRSPHTRSPQRPEAARCTRSSTWRMAGEAPTTP